MNKKVLCFYIFFLWRFLVGRIFLYSLLVLFSRESHVLDLWQSDGTATNEELYESNSPGKWRTILSSKVCTKVYEKIHEHLKPFELSVFMLLIKKVLMEYYNPSGSTQYIYIYLETQSWRKLSSAFLFSVISVLFLMKENNRLIPTKALFKI